MLGHYIPWTLLCRLSLCTLLGRQNVSSRPKGVDWPPGLTSLCPARAVCNAIGPGQPQLTLLRSAQVVSSAIVDKYIGESARLVREMFGYAKEHQVCSSAG